MKRVKCVFGLHIPDNDWVRDFKTSRMICNCTQCGRVVKRKKK